MGNMVNIRNIVWELVKHHILNAIIFYVLLVLVVSAFFQDFTFSKSGYLFIASIGILMNKNLLPYNAKLRWLSVLSFFC